MTRRGSVGKVVNMGASSSLIVKGTEAPGIGTVVSDKRGRIFGKIIRITGPVKAPYIIVKVSGEGGDLSRMLGQEMYIAAASDKKERRKRTEWRGSGRKHEHKQTAERRKVHRVKRVKK